MSMDELPIRDEVRALYDPMVRFRRDLHAHPEIGFQEHRTAQKIVEALRPAYNEVRTGIAKTGVTALLSPPRAVDRSILLRADMDALPLQEESDAPYASRNAGAMHACGHDGHTAILVHTALAAAAAPDRFGGRVRFAFQPAEEGPGGALPMIQAGILANPPIEAAFGLHLWSGMPTGKIGIAGGPIMAAADEFEIVVHGKGGHGAYPHETVDAVLTASHLVVALQTLVSRNTDPTETAVVSVGLLRAGDNFNIIAEKALLRGTLRTFDSALREHLIRRLREVSEGTCALFGATCDFVFKDHYPATVNDQAMADFVAGLAAELVGSKNVIRSMTSMGGEDMSYFLREVPGAFFFLGAGNEESGAVHPHHSPRFNIDEDAMLIGAEMFLRIMERYWTVFQRPPKRGANG